LKSFVLDTNVLIHSHKSLHLFDNNQIIIPMTVLEELDKLKSRDGEVGYNARMAIKTIDGVFKQDYSQKHATLGDTKLIIGQTKFKNKPKLDIEHPDNRIILTAFETKSILVSRDINVRVKAQGIGVKSEDFHGDKIVIHKDKYTGWVKYKASDEEINDLQIKKEIKVSIEVQPNEYVLVINDNHKSIPCKNIDDKLVIVEKLSGIGISPMNFEQKYLMDMIMNDDIKLVTVTGKSGSGKSLVSIAGALEQIIGNADIKYDRLIIVKPLVPVGNSMGFLPGDISDKLAPNSASIFDSLNVIFGSKGFEKEGNTYSPKEHFQYLIDTHLLLIEPLEFMRGRNIGSKAIKTIVIIDEGQNCSKAEMKTLLTRVGEYGKVIITGDSKQVDHPKLDHTNNGLIHVIKAFYKYKIAGHIHLSTCERSELAGLADEIL